MFRDRPLNKAELDNDIVSNRRQVVAHQGQVGPALLPHGAASRARQRDFLDFHGNGKAHRVFGSASVVTTGRVCMVRVMDATRPRTLVLGLGNTLLRDEAVGVRVAEHLAGHPEAEDLGLRCLDGGTMGLSLLIEMEDAEAMVVVDAADLGKEAGEVQVFEGAEMDSFLRTRSRNAHDIGLDDLMDALRLRQAVPERRALLGIQPADMRVGEDMTEQVAAAVPAACDLIVSLARRWCATG